MTQYRLGSEGIPMPEQLIMDGAAVIPEQSGSISRILIGQGDRWTWWWGKHNAALPPSDGALILHSAVLAYMSDFHLASNVMQPHLPGVDFGHTVRVCAGPAVRLGV